MSSNSSTVITLALSFLNSFLFKFLYVFIAEMAERHNMPDVLKLARNLVLQLQTIIENK